MELRELLMMNTLVLISISCIVYIVSTISKSVRSSMEFFKGILKDMIENEE